MTNHEAAVAARPTRPRVTVGVPVFNGERYLAETLASILSQDLEDIEVLVSDNGSTDRTCEIVEEFAARDPRVTLLRSDTNKGAAHNYNKLVSAASAPYFKWASADDLCDSRLLRLCADVLDRHPSVVLAYPQTLLIDAEGRSVGEYDDRLHIMGSDPADRLARFATRRRLCNACFGLIRRDALDRTRLIGPYVSSDIVFLAELLLHGSFYEVQERLFSRRKTDTSCGLGTLSRRQVQAWFSPGTRTGILPPLLRVFLEILRAVLVSDLELAARLRTVGCFSVAWVSRRSRVRFGLFRQAVRRSIRRRGERAPAVG